MTPENPGKHPKTPIHCTHVARGSCRWALCERPAMPGWTLCLEHQTHSDWVLESALRETVQ
jgi:hypothetical protein